MERIHMVGKMVWSYGKDDWPSIGLSLRFIAGAEPRTQVQYREKQR
jgi:hypothetical protein